MNGALENSKLKKRFFKLKVLCGPSWFCEELFETFSCKEPFLVLVLNQMVLLKNVIRAVVGSFWLHWVTDRKRKWTCGSGHKFMVLHIFVFFHWFVSTISWRAQNYREVIWFLSIRTRRSLKFEAERSECSDRRNIHTLVLDRFLNLFIFSFLQIYWEKNLQVNPEWK